MFMASTSMALSKPWNQHRSTIKRTTIGTDGAGLLAARTTHYSEGATLDLSNAGSLDDCRRGREDTPCSG